MARGKSAFLEKQQRLIQANIDAAYSTAIQYEADMAIITLAEEFGFGPVRCKRFWDALQKNCIAYNDALGWDNKKQMRTGQTEFLRDRMDEKLRNALGEHYTEDFNGRYEYARDVKL